MAQHEHPDAVRTLYDGKHIRLVSRGNWEYVTRKGVCGIVGFVAVTNEQKLLLVEQPRKPVAANVIELPAGLAGDQAGHDSEDLAVAARRELLEETGYEAAHMRHLVAGAASAGITDEMITLFLATGLAKTGSGAGDGSEQITLHEVPLADVESWSAMRRLEGKVIDLKVYAGLHFARVAALG